MIVVKLPFWIAPFEDKDLIRLGRNMDGGYSLNQKSLLEVTTLYSFGIGHDWTFEQDFLEFRKLNGLDSRIYAWDNRIGFSYFLKIGLRGLLKLPFGLIEITDSKLRVNEFIQYCKMWKLSAQVKHIRETVSRHSIKSMKIPLKSYGIKMDIEGSEWPILREKSEFLADANFIVIELHSFGENIYEFKYLLSWLEEYFWISHLHVNNSGGLVSDVPNVIELTLTSNRFPKPKKRVRNLPMLKLDFPNNPQLPDFAIQFESQRSN